MRHDSDLSFNFFSPTKVVFGNGTVNEVLPEANELGIKKAILITDPVLAGMDDVYGRVKKAAGPLVAGEFTECTQDSGVDVVNRAYAAALAMDADGVISVGGGSVIDTAKGVSLLMAERGDLRDHVGFQNMSRPAAPHIVLPTTAGTGSEVTYVAVIKDHEAHKKLLFADYKLIPRVAILDPGLTVGLPAGLTAATGMDAISHAIESMHSSQGEYIADGLALHALRLLKEAIPICVKNPGDIKARGAQLVAATMAGAAFSNAQVGLVHAMAHTVGAKYGLHHGLLNAIFLPHVVRFNCEDTKDAYMAVARAFDLSTDGNICDTLADFLANFAASLGLEMHLGKLGVPRDAITDLAMATIEDASIVYNGRMVFDPEELIPVYEASM